MRSLSWLSLSLSMLDLFVGFLFILCVAASYYLYTSQKKGGHPLLDLPWPSTSVMFMTSLPSSSSWNGRKNMVSDQSPTTSLMTCEVYLIATSESLRSHMVVVAYFFILCTVLTPTYHWFKKNMAGRKIGSRYPSLSSIIDGPQTTSQNLSQRFRWHLIQGLCLSHHNVVVSIWLLSYRLTMSISCIKSHLPTLKWIPMTRIMTTS